ncbi:YhdP family protein [Alteromonadaceae bacterium BrNp21-10]|nr:YhdP family protein [Alteromonadaceae bacterium BrNp21-10]
MKPVSFYLGYLIKKLWMTSAFLLILLALLISVLRFSLPHMDEQKHLVEDWLSSQYGTQVKIGSISADWKGAGPALIINDVILAAQHQSPIKLSINQISIDVDFWNSIRSQQLVSKRFNLLGLQMSLDSFRLGSEEVNYPVVDALENLFLNQLHRFSIIDSSVQINTEFDSQRVVIQRLSWINKDDRHQGVGQLQVADLAVNSASFILDLYGEGSDLTGTFYADGEDLDISPWLKAMVADSAGAQLQESRVNFKLWADIQHSQVNDLLANVLESRFSWDNAQQTTAQINHGTFKARPYQQGWVINLNNLDFQLMVEPAQILSTTGFIQGDGSFSLHMQDVAIEPLLPLLPLFVEPEALKILQQIQPQGVIEEFSLAVNGGSSKVLLRASELTNQPWDLLPGMSDIQANFYWQDNIGSLQLSADQGVMQSQALTGQDLSYQYWHGQVFLRAEDEGLDWYIPELVFAGDDLNFKQSAQYTSATDWLALSLKVEAMDVAEVPALFSAELMGQDTVSYLSRALQGGEVASANIIWHGALSGFPYVKNQGVFQAHVDITDATFVFDDAWPALQDLDMRLLFENDNLTMSAQQGRLLDVAMQSMHAKIPGLSADSILSIDIAALADADAVSALMLQGGLADSVGKALQEINIDGALAADVHLHIPLSGNNVVASGKIRFEDNPVKFTSLDFALESLSGSLEFENDHIQGKGLIAELAGQEIQLSIDGQDQPQGFVTNVKLSGHWQVDPVLESYYPGLDRYLAGIFDWRAKLALTIPEQGFDYQFSLTSDLPRLLSVLPEPFSKPAGEKLALLVKVDGNQLASNSKVILGDIARFDGILPHQEAHFSRAHLSIGDDDLISMGAGFSISSNLQRVEWDAWYDALHTLINETPKIKGQAVLGNPDRIFFKASEVTAMGQQFHKVAATAKRLQTNWLIELNADEIKAEIDINHDWLGKGISVNADFVNIKEWQDDPEAEEIQLDMATLPPLQVVCERCRYQQFNLGKLELSLSRASNGMLIDSLRMTKNDSVLNASGNWYIDNGVASTRLKGKFESGDFGDLLKDFELNSGIRDSGANMDFDISWQKAPYAFNFDTLNGQVNWRLNDGYLSEVSDKGARIFSILSLKSLVRKLKLDFRDVFSKGFFYDKMTGTFEVNAGVVNTNDTLIDGAAGEMRLNGYTNLSDQALNYNIAFTPKVTSSLPVILAWMINPATAIAALALDEMITSAQVVSSINYSLTGSIEDPILKELGRESREIILPASTLPKSVPSEDPNLEQPADPTYIPNTSPDQTEAPDLLLPVDGVDHG